MSLYVDFNACFFAETFQPMNAAVTFQIGLNDNARAIRGKITFAGALERFQGIRTICVNGTPIQIVHYMYVAFEFIVRIIMSKSHQTKTKHIG